MAHSKPERTSAKLSEYQENKKWNRTFSSVVCFLLDNLGYCDDMRKFRECAYDILANEPTRLAPDLTFMLTGSKGEGASKPLQGDTDYMVVTGDILCLENDSRFPDIYILKSERDVNVPPGYTRVVAVHTEAPSFMGRICSSSVVYFTKDGLPYISSAIFNNILRNILSSVELTNYQGISHDHVSFNGPAFTRICSSSINIGGIIWSDFPSYTDTVLSIYCFSSLFTSKLATRLRRSEWFSPTLIDSICSTEGFIVPVGSTEGEDPDLEWRISYVMTENKIIRNLNTTQFKLYVIMKMIAKELIYPDSPVISSYVVKNVVLWICELNSHVCDPNPRVCALTSRPDLLLDLIAKCLSFVKTCVINNHLPNYVIPERNLIASRLTLQSKQQLVDHLDVLLKEGRNIFYKLNIFIKHSQLALVLAPSSVFFYGRKRDEIEKLELLLSILFNKHLEIPQFFRPTLFLERILKGGCDIHVNYIFWKQWNLVVPEWIALMSSGHFQVLVDLVEARFLQYLS